MLPRYHAQFISPERKLAGKRGSPKVATFAMLVSSTSMNAASDTTNAISQGFTLGVHTDSGLATLLTAAGATIVQDVSVTCNCAQLAPATCTRRTT